MTRQEMAAIMMADGPWECRPHGGFDWTSTSLPRWNWDFWEYRVKPQPKVLWVNEQQDHGIGYFDKGMALHAGSKAPRDSQPIRRAVRYVESPEE